MWSLLSSPLICETESCTDCRLFIPLFHPGKFLPRNPGLECAVSPQHLRNPWTFGIGVPVQNLKPELLRVQLEFDNAPQFMNCCDSKITDNCGIQKPGCAHTMSSLLSLGEMGYAGILLCSGCRRLKTHALKMHGTGPSRMPIAATGRRPVGVCADGVARYAGFLGGCSGGCYASDSELLPATSCNA